MTALLPYAFALVGVLALSSVAHSIIRGVRLARAIMADLASLYGKD